MPSTDTAANSPRKRSARLPAAGRALIIFWCVILLLVGSSAATLAWLGPPHKKNAPEARPEPDHVKTATRPGALPVARARVPAGPHLTLLISGYGYSADLAEKTLDSLPREIGLIISPYLPEGVKRVASARARGHEVFLNLPVQGAAPEEISTGPHALGYGNTAAQDRAALDWNLAQAPGIIGVSTADPASHETIAGPGYAATPDFRPIARMIEKAGLLVLTNGAQRSGLPADIRADTRLDLDADDDTVQRALAHIADRALQGENPVIVTTTITPNGLQHLAIWCGTLAGQGIHLAQPSAMLAAHAVQSAPPPMTQDAVGLRPLPPTLEQTL